MEAETTNLHSRRMALELPKSTYLTDIFRPGVASREEARLLALSFYGPMFLLYSLYDSGERNAAALLDRHMARFAKEHPALSVRTQKEG